MKAEKHSPRDLETYLLQNRWVKHHDGNKWSAPYKAEWPNEFFLEAMDNVFWTLEAAVHMQGKIDAWYKARTDQIAKKLLDDKAAEDKTTSDFLLASGWQCMSGPIPCLWTLPRNKVSELPEPFQIQFAGRRGFHFEQAYKLQTRINTWEPPGAVTPEQCERQETIVCPHCGHRETDPSEFADSGSGPCNACGKKFFYERNIKVTYTSVRTI